MTVDGDQSESVVVQSTHDRFKSLESEASTTSLKLESITDGFNPRGIPTVKFVDDIGEFANSFSPPASAELLIGAYSDLFAKFKSYEESLSQKREWSNCKILKIEWENDRFWITLDLEGIRFQQKIPEIEKSLTLVKYLKAKQAADEVVITRYNLADTLYAKAELECNGTVNLWLGANVMLEYTYDEAIELLSTKEESAKREYQNVSSVDMD
jgi:Prefoldin subunit